MAIDMTKIKHILFTLFSIGSKQTSVIDNNQTEVFPALYLQLVSLDSCSRFWIYMNRWFPLRGIFFNSVVDACVYSQLWRGSICFNATKNSHKCIWIVLYLWLTQLQDFYTFFFLYLQLEYFSIKDWIAFWISLATKNSMNIIILAPALTGSWKFVFARYKLWF